MVRTDYAVEVTFGASGKHLLAQSLEWCCDVAQHVALQGAMATFMQVQHRSVGRMRPAENLSRRLEQFVRATGVSGGEARLSPQLVHAGLEVYLYGDKVSSPDVIKELNSRLAPN